MNGLDSSKYLIFALIIGQYAFLGSCSLINQYDMREDTIQTCTDPERNDEDGDGLRNCEDPECQELFLDPANKEHAEEIYFVWLEQDQGCIELIQSQHPELCYVIDEDLDGYVGCQELDCAIQDYSYFLSHCKPTDYAGYPEFEDEFKGSVGENGNENWRIYGFSEDGAYSTSSVSLSQQSGWKITSSVSEDAPQYFIEEKGIYSKEFFHFWGNITDFIVKMRITGAEDQIVMIGIALDSLQNESFLDVPSGSIDYSKKVGMMLQLKKNGQFRLCKRRNKKEGLNCGRWEQSQYNFGNSTFYRINITDELVAIYIGDTEDNFELIATETDFNNPIGEKSYRPGVGRFFIVASTDKAGYEERGEVIVENFKVYQVSLDNKKSFDYSFKGEEGNPGWNGSSCSFNDTNQSMDISWSSRIRDSCSVFIDDEISSGKFEMDYKFMVNSLVAINGVTERAYFLPGLWDPLMNFEMGMAFAAGISKDSNESSYLVFRPCTSTSPENEVKMDGYGVEKMKLNVLSGYDPEKNFAYAVFQEEQNNEWLDLFSFVYYGVACYNLTNFGVTSKFVSSTNVFSEGSIFEVNVFGIVNSESLESIDF